MSTFSIQVFTSIKNNYQKASTIKKIIVTLQNNSITMKDLAEKSLLLWQEEQFSAMEREEFLLSVAEKLQQEEQQMQIMR